MSCVGLWLTGLVKFHPGASDQAKVETLTAAILSVVIIREITAPSQHGVADRW